MRVDNRICTGGVDSVVWNGVLYSSNYILVKNCGSNLSRKYVRIRKP